DQLRDRLVRAAVIQDRHLPEIQDRQAERADLADLALDPEAHGAPRGARDQVRIKARDRAGHEARQLEAERDDVPRHVRHASLLAGNTIPICAPGKCGNFSSSGGASSQSGTSAIRAVPHRIETLPPQRPTCLRICLSPWPRPGSWNRVSPWMNAASSAAASPQRSPKRAACVPAREPLNPIPRSTTPILTTLRSRRGIRLYVCVATHPVAWACSRMFWH